MTLIDRRDWLLGAGGLIAAAGAFALMPRSRMNLMGGYRLEDKMPRQVGAWREDPGMGVVMPPTEGSLADRLYDQIFSRAYIDPATPDRSPVMLFASHGADQSDSLQLHRPEACYPAIGFTMVGRELLKLPVGAAALPAVSLTMQFGERFEDILYWARVGDALPQDDSEQRMVRMKQTLNGVVLDGLLMRLSAIRRADQPPLHGLLAEFTRGMLAAVDRKFLPALIGRDYTRQLLA